MLIEPVSFTGKFVWLHPMKSLHSEPLRRAANNDAIWTHHLPNPPIREGFRPWFETAIKEFEKGAQLPFVIVCAKNKDVIGSIRYYNIVPEHQRLHLGHSWLNPSHWETPTFYETKFFLMQYAFEVLKYRRIEITTDVRNLQLHKKLKTMGAVAESVIIGHMKSALSHYLMHSPSILSKLSDV